VVLRPLRPAVGARADGLRPRALHVLGGHRPQVQARRVPRLRRFAPRARRPRDAPDVAATRARFTGEAGPAGRRGAGAPPRRRPPPPAAVVRRHRRPPPRPAAAPARPRPPPPARRPPPPPPPPPASPSVAGHRARGRT